MFCIKNADSRPNYAPGDPVLIKNIVLQLKSQGVFDQFRKECISDVETKPAYQNLCHRVDGRVEAFLSETKWVPDLNRNQLHESIRKHVNECTFVDSGISRIVDQLVNPRINTVLVPKVEEIVYSYLGIQRPDNDQFSNNRPFEKAELLADNHKSCDENPALRITSENFLTTSSSNEQNQLSSNNVYSNFRNEVESEHVRLFTAESVDLKMTNGYPDFYSDDDDISPPFEPLVKSDDEWNAEFDYSPKISDSKCDDESHPSVILKLDTPDPTCEPRITVCDDSFRDVELACGDENEVLATDSRTDKPSSREPSSPSSLPATPIMICDMTDESQEIDFNQNLRRICTVDTSSEKTFLDKVSGDDQGSSSNFNENNINENCKTEREQEIVVLNEEKRIRIDSAGSEDSKRNEKNSDNKKDRSHNSEKDRKSHRNKDKDRSSRTSKDVRNRDREERNKDADRNKYSEGSSKHDSKHRDSSKGKSSSEKNQSSSSRSKGDNSKDDRKMKDSSSKYDTGRDREKGKQEKKENDESKKNKTQCNTDGKKKRTDRRSSDRDSNGPFSSSYGSTSHRISNKTDRHRHSSSSSSSHKTEKNSETKESDALFDTMLSVKGKVDASSDIVVTPMDTNIQSASCVLDIFNKNGKSKMSCSINESHQKEESCSITRSGEKKEGNEFVGNKEIVPGSKSKLNDISVFSRKDSSPTNKSLKVCTLAPELKKPKIAKNAADVLRIMKLRKQYQQKLEAEQLLQQRGKENTVSSGKKKVSSIDNYRTSIQDNFVQRKVNKNEKNRRDAVIKSFTDCELKIRRIDSYYRLLNGSCTLNQVQNFQSIGNKENVNVYDIDTTNRNEDSNQEKHPKSNAQAQSKDTVNDLRDDPRKVKMNRADTESALQSENRGCDTAVPLPTVTKACLVEETDEVRYFKPPELNADFVNFVSKRVKRMEEIFLENFSIRLMCPARYDFIFRDKLGAIVKRGCTISEIMSSPFKYNSEIIDGKIGNEKGIMMRIKKSVLKEESASQPDSDGLSKKLTNSAMNISANSNRVVSSTGKTKAIKRRFSNPISVMNTEMVESNRITDTSKVFDSNKSISMIPDSEIVDSERTSVKSCGSFDSAQIPHNITLDSQKSSTSSNSSVHSSGASAPKMLKTISKEQKRRQFYYEANDLYKPRPSFILSSRRSRGLDPNTA